MKERLQFIRNAEGKVLPYSKEIQGEIVVANVTDAALEKHVPEVTFEASSVKAQIGSIIHPMLEVHHIEWIILETDKDYYKRDLNVGEEPIASFELTDDEKPLAVYEYCNLHGLWKKEL